jgi:hypothetical protein
MGKFRDSWGTRRISLSILGMAANMDVEASSTLQGALLVFVPEAQRAGRVGSPKPHGVKEMRDETSRRLKRLTPHRQVSR